MEKVGVMIGIRNAIAFAIAMIFVLCAACTGKPAQQQDSTADRSLAKRIESVVQPLIDDGWAQGIMVGVLQNGKENYFAFGSIANDAQTPPDKNSIFEIGSITKVFTAIVLADMVTRGEIKLGDPVAKYLSDDPEVPEPGGEPITMEDLASHTSGLPLIPMNFWKNGDNRYDNNTAGLRWNEYSRVQLDAYLKNPVPPPNESRNFIYSNLGVGILGYALEQTADMPLETLITQRICKPLGMETTSFTLKTSGPGHNVDGEPVNNWIAGESLLSGAFALRSTCSDMLKFAAANLDPKSSPMAEALTLAQQPVAEINDSVKSALGWKVNKFGVIYSLGATGGFRCTVYLHPPSRTAVVLMANTQVGGAVGGRATLFDSLGGSLLNVALNVAPIPVDFPSPVQIVEGTPGGTPGGTLGDFVGFYRPANGSKDPSFPVRETGGKLFALGPGNVDLRLWPLGNDTFFTRTYISEIRFQRDDSGIVTGADFQFEGQRASLTRSNE